MGKKWFLVSPYSHIGTAKKLIFHLGQMEGRWFLGATRLQEIELIVCHSAIRWGFPSETEPNMQICLT